MCSYAEQQSIVEVIIDHSPRNASHPPDIESSAETADVPLIGSGGRFSAETEEHFFMPGKMKDVPRRCPVQCSNNVST
jgi:hypothetical protein